MKDEENSLTSSMEYPFNSKPKSRKQAGFTTNMLAKMGRDEPVSMETLAKICTFQILLFFGLLVFSIAYYSCIS